MAKAKEILPNNQEPVYEDYHYEVLSAFKTSAMYSFTKSPKSPMCYYNYKKQHKSKKFEITARNLNYCTMFIFYEGNFGFVFDNIAYHPNAGDIFFIKNGTIFSTFFMKNTYIDCYEITFPLSFFECFDDNSIFHKLFFEDTENGYKIISTNSSGQNKMLDIFNEIDALIDSDNEFKDILCYSNIIKILGIIYSQTDNQINDNSVIKIPHKLKEATNYIHENFTTPISIKDIADACQISSSYLTRLFKKTYKNTPLEYITTLRITYSKNLLKTGLSISDACYRSGFSDYNYYITKFKAITGTTPNKYKKK